MNIHEYQAKQVLARFGVPVPKGQFATTPDEAAAAFTALGRAKAVVKAQIHAGGRGKAGGVKLQTVASDVRDFAAKLLGKPLVTHQTGPEGRVVRRVYVEEASDVARELYLGMLVDRKAGTVSVIASTEGGMDIEDVAAKTPEKILTEPINPLLGVAGFQARKIAFALGLKDKQVGQFAALLASLYRAFIETDASLIEINPLVVTTEGRVICLDAKMSFDDNGLFRHPDIRELRDANEEDPAETEAGSTISAMSISTATSDAWSTARVSRWPRWTSSRFTAPSRPTSSTLAVALAPRRWPRHFASCSRTSASKAC